MGIIQSQLANVVEWKEYRDDVIFWMWSNCEIKKGSRLILRSGQDAVFIKNGKIEGVFTDDGDYDIESQIIPFLSTLKGFKFGFNSGMRAEVMFVNTKEMQVKWGTKNAISLPCAGLPGGMPIRCFGSFSFKVDSLEVLVENVAGVKSIYKVDDIKERVIASLDQLVMKWITNEGKDMFNLQASASGISRGIMKDLNMELMGIGVKITSFSIQNFSYPEEVQKMQTKVAAQAMVGDMGRYTQMAMLDNMGTGGAASQASGVAMQAMQMQMGMNMAREMMQSSGDMVGANRAGVISGGNTNGSGNIPNFCPNCGNHTNGMKFCGNCGNKLG